MLKKAALAGGALVTLLNCGCGSGGIGQWIDWADVAMQTADVLRTFGIV